MLSPFLKGSMFSYICQELLWSRCNKCCKLWSNQGTTCKQSFGIVLPSYRNLYSQTSRWSSRESYQSVPKHWTSLLISVSWYSWEHLDLFGSKDSFLIQIWSMLGDNHSTILKVTPRFFMKNSLLRLASFDKELRCEL